MYVQIEELNHKYPDFRDGKAYPISDLVIQFILRILIYSTIFNEINVVTSSVPLAIENTVS